MDGELFVCFCRYSVTLLPGLRPLLIARGEPGANIPTAIPTTYQ